MKAEADYRRAASKARSRLSPTASPSVAQSNTREAEGKDRSADRERDKIVDLQKQIAKKHSNLAAAEMSFAREEEHARKAKAQTDKRAAEAQKRDAGKQKRISEEHAQTQSRELSVLRGQVHGMERDLRSVRTALTRELPDVATVLLAFADPPGTLRLDREMRAIHQAVRLSEQRDHIRLEARWAVRPADITQAILDTCPVVVHFSGHGSETSELAFEGEDGAVRVIDPADLVGLVRAIGQSCVSLYNACWSAEAATAMAERVEVAIGMDAPITDLGVRAFAEGFYRAVGSGTSVAAAFEAGRFELRNTPVPRAAEAEPVLQHRADVDPEAVFLVAGASPAFGVSLVPVRFMQAGASASD